MTVYNVGGSTSVGDVFREHARSRGDLLAVAERGIELTYAELDQRVNRAANALRSAGVGESDRVLWLGQNSFRLVELLGAVAKLGACVVPANWRSSAEELAFVIDDIKPTLVVWQEAEIGDMVRRAREMATADAVWVQHDAEHGPDAADLDYETFVGGSPDEDPAVTVDPATPVLGIYTAAFEGRPNCALLSHLSILIEGVLVGRVAEVSDATVFLNSGPMFHLGTLMTTLATMVHGGTNVIISRTDAEEVCDLVQRYRCTKAFLMAPTVDQIRELNADSRWDLSSLWPSPDPQDWSMCTPSHNPSSGRAGGYGQSEVTGLITSHGLGRQTDSKYGRPLPLGQVRIVDDDGNDVPTGELGEIACRGPMMMTGYWNRPEINAARNMQGWHRTGDLGRRAADGSIEFVAPRQKMIKSASENVYPVEVERCLLEHPAVVDVCVIGVPDERWHQSVKALIVLAEGTHIDAAELVEHCRRRIASYKKPRLVEFVERLERRPDRSLDRDWADRTYGGGGYPGEVNSGAHPVRPVVSASR